MFVILFALILRPVGFKFRGKLPGQRWRNGWHGVSTAASTWSCSAPAWPRSENCACTAT